MTQRDRLRVYEKFMHQMSIYVTAMHSEKIKQGVQLIDNWSYAHRCGNGEYSERQQRKIVEDVIRKMEAY